RTGGEKQRRDRLQRVVLRLDQDLHRPPAMRRDRRPLDFRRQHHPDRHRLLPAGPHPNPTRRRQPMNPNPAAMFVYALHDPIDDFDALTPLPQWIAADPLPRTRWTLQAVLALADTAAQVRWDGDMRHQPSVGATLAPPETFPYLVVKQDNNGTTFVVSA